MLGDEFSLNGERREDLVKMLTVQQLHPVHFKRRFTKPEAGIPHDAAHRRDGLLAIFVNELKLRPIIGVQAIAQTQREKD